MPYDKNISLKKELLKHYKQMKRYLITAVLAVTVSMGYAQKAELSSAQKAFDAKNYQEALSAAQKAQDVISSNPAATSAQKAQAMYIKAASALELAGDDVTKVAEAVKLMADVVAFEKGKEYSARNISTKKVEVFDTQEALDEAMISGGYDKQKIVDRARTYSPQVTAKLTELSQKLYSKAIENFNSQQFAAAAKYFDATYEAQAQCSPRPDTSAYNNSAVCMIQIQDYPAAAAYYKKLIEMGYTGMETMYMAKNELSGKMQSYASKKDRDAEVKLKVASEPKDSVLPNKQPEIYTTLLQILFQESKKAEPYNFTEFFKYADMAIAKYPEIKEFPLIKGQAYYELGENAKFYEILESAAAKFPTDATIFYNMGYIQSELKNNAKAEECYRKAIAIDPKYVDAYINIAALYREANNAIIDEMSAMPFTLNKEQKARYDELKKQNDANVKKMIEVIEEGFNANPDNVNLAKNLENLYNTVGDTANEKKYAEIYEKLMAE